MKLDLDDLERRATAAESDEWQWRPANGDILEGKHNAQVVLAGEDLTCSVSDRAHIEANSPPVTLALITRIRELETAGRGRLAAPPTLTESEWIAILDKGAVLP